MHGMCTPMCGHTSTFWSRLTPTSWSPMDSSPRSWASSGVWSRLDGKQNEEKKKPHSQNNYNNNNFNKLMRVTFRKFTDALAGSMLAHGSQRPRWAALAMVPRSSFNWRARWNFRSPTYYFHLLVFEFVYLMKGVVYPFETTKWWYMDRY